MNRDAILGRLRELRDETGDTRLLAFVRIGFGLLLGHEAWLATDVYRRVGFFGSYFHQPMLPEALVASIWLYRLILGAQWATAVAIVAGRQARGALLVAASLLLYTMLCDRLAFHHYRHTMIAFSTLLAFTPCDRHLVVGRASDDEAAPLWAANAIKVQVSVMYLASGGSKLLDPEWRGGLQMRGMVRSFSRLVERRGIPDDWIAALQHPVVSSWLAKGAIATELSLAIFLWWPPTRRLALWVGLLFHLTISLMTPVLFFTLEMLLVYLVFVTPDREARVLRSDPARPPLAAIIEAFDWLGRYRLELTNKTTLVVVDRGGVEQRGIQAAACVFGTLPVLFLAWPAVALAARIARPRDLQATPVSTAAS
jgi:Vitamin K-dependent gamma-carboxylase